MADKVADKTEEDTLEGATLVYLQKDFPGVTMAEVREAILRHNQRTFQEHQAALQSTGEEGVEEQRMEDWCTRMDDKP